MFKLFYTAIAIFFSFIVLMFSLLWYALKSIINFIFGKPNNNKSTIKRSIPSKQTFKHKQRTYEYDKENNIWHLSEEDKRIAKEERMTYADYIEAEERDDDNLDNDE